MHTLHSHDGVCSAISEVGIIDHAQHIQKQRHVNNSFEIEKRSRQQRNEENEDVFGVR